MKCYTMSGNTKISVIRFKIHQKKYGSRKNQFKTKNLDFKLGPKFHTRNEHLKAIIKCISIKEGLICTKRSEWEFR